MRIIILGYTGIIGKSILESLAKNKKLNIICVGRNTKNKTYSNSKIKYYKWDFLSFKKKNLFFLNKANIIINCTGKTNGTQNNFENINFIFIKKLLQYINYYKCKVRLIHLSSIAVYDASNKYFRNFKLISEKSKINAKDLYSKSKLNADLLIQNNIKKNFSFTILRISNVFGGRSKSNLFKFFLFSLKFRFWIKCSNNVLFNFINVKDVAQAIILTASKLKISKNNIYIVSDDCKQYQVYQSYENFYHKRIYKTQVPKQFIKFLIYFLPLPKKIVNFFLLISNNVSYSNKKIKNDLNFKPKFSLYHKLKFIND